MKINFRIQGLEAAPVEPEKPVTSARCCTCDEWYPIKDLDGEWESESWEMPEKYFIHYCPKCPDGGCICDYA